MTRTQPYGCMCPSLLAGRAARPTFPTSPSRPQAACADPRRYRPADTADLATSLVRVLDDDGRRKAPGPRPSTPSACAAGLRDDEDAHLRRRMLLAQRQKKLSFYMQCLGEEAIAVAHSLALRTGTCASHLPPAGPAAGA